MLADKTAISELVSGLLQGQDRPLSRGLSIVERGGPVAEELVRLVHPHTGNAHVVGVTGSPGSGKSTLSSALARAATLAGLRVGIIAVDPSSPYSGGSILGDRIRMNDVSLECGVFIRSLATHGALGGLSHAVADSVDLMDAAGRQLILIETVGVGQDEVDIMYTAHTVIVVSVPGLGDEIQTLKAGVLEISDIHVVNKGDRDGADRIMGELTSMLTLGANFDQRGWRPPILKCIATEGDLGELLQIIQKHLVFLKDSGEYQQRSRRMVQARLLSILRELSAAIVQRPERHDDLIADILYRRISPYQGGRDLLSRVAEFQEGVHRRV